MVQDSGVAQESLTIRRTVASSIEKSPVGTIPNDNSSLSRGTDLRHVRALTDSNSNVVEPITEAEVDFIDFGALVREVEPNKEVTVRLQFPNDGSSCKTLTMGRGEHCDIKLEEPDIGEYQKGNERPSPNPAQLPR